MTFHKRTSLSVSLTILLLGLSGCGGATRPPMGYVSGTVTMDGQPVEDIIIIMKPEKGRPAMTRTDKNGFYDIEYIKGEKGTKIGPTTVSFEWPLGGKATFAVPKKYVGDESELKFEVKKGKQTFDVKLTSDAAEPKPAKTIAPEKVVD